MKVNGINKNLFVEVKKVDVNVLVILGDIKGTRLSVTLSKDQWDKLVKQEAEG